MKIRWLLAFFIPLSLAHAGVWDETTIGVRGGTSLNERSKTFRQVEAHLDFQLPWKWNLGENFSVRSRLDTAAGWLRGDDQDGFVGRVGPSLELWRRHFPLSLEGGSSPTYISRYAFRERNYGVHFQFTTHIGLNWNVTEHVRFAYRYQHMSNAGIGTPNPGLNLHMLGLSYRF
jgi:Lipid A 3-O-deacylase (PagL).